MNVAQRMEHLEKEIKETGGLVEGRVEACLEGTRSRLLPAPADAPCLIPGLILGPRRLHPPSSHPLACSPSAACLFVLQRSWWRRCRVCRPSSSPC